MLKIVIWSKEELDEVKRETEAESMKGRRVRHSKTKKWEGFVDVVLVLVVKKRIRVDHM